MQSLQLLARVQVHFLFFEKAPAQKFLILHMLHFEIVEEPT